MLERLVIGIDSGSASCSVVALDLAGNLVAHASGFHHGKATEILRALLGSLTASVGDAYVGGLARSSSAPDARAAGRESFAVDSHVAEIEALRRFHPGARTLLVVGAERFARMSFDGRGKYLRMRRNSSCAAGTGSFLDQQAARLGLPGGSAALAERALANPGEFPSIASRCSVFAKTDLTHAQAEGWSLEEICDGLCNGLARNIADTLFPGEKPEAPIVMAGGVSRNRAVLKHLEALAGSRIEVDAFSHLYGAIGAALRLLAAEPEARAAAPERSGEAFRVADIEIFDELTREYADEGLGEPSEGYPDFASRRRFLHVARKNGPGNPVEVDVYEPLASPAPLPVLLGIDIGSTSTKAALVAPGGSVLAGFYTRTAGKPLEATQSIFEAAERVAREEGASFEVTLAATTGSGRKFVGTVIGADAAVDEITAHARAALELDPETDTIIEIGGQDSKFTSLSGGVVTFSQMNAVCAAGTGSFLEEQAGRLGVGLADFAPRAAGNKAPLTSDRCTVFMERDLNHFRGRGYATGELLAASLFSVCDNYLGKVAREGSIGKRVAFQGATARNRALVAAFEKRLGKPVRVSKFCHLTGAIGAALEARDSLRGKGGATAFRGFRLHELDLVSRVDRCGLCPNDCRLRVVDVDGEDVAYGFLCGRDQATRRYVKEGGRDLLAERKRAIETAYARVERSSPPRAGWPSVGIPGALYLHEDAPFWKAFFERLGFRAVMADDGPETLRAGKRLAGAEFCAPMAMFHGQADALLEKADLVFLPTYLAEKPERLREGEATRSYCNFAQYAPVVTRAAEERERPRIVSPVLVGRRGDASRAMEALRESLEAALAPWGVRAPARKTLEKAYAACLEAKALARHAVRGIHARERDAEGMAVVVVGRPYAVLSDAMGKGIVDVLRRQAEELWYADMLPGRAAEGEAAIDPMLAAFHWRYAAELLEAAHWCARHPRWYPVLVTTFKCSPDSIAIEWFRRVMDASGKPYLVLQVDDHDSAVGYETRIEAGLRSFRNHFRRAAETPASFAPSAQGRAPEPTPAPATPAGEGAPGARGGTARAKPRAAAARPEPALPRVDPKGKTLLFPAWDPYVCPLLAANLRAAGMDVRVLEESPLSIRRAMGTNTGQCIPMNVIARECVEAVDREKLDPAKTVLWVPTSKWPCNIPLYPHFIKSLMEKQGGGMERLEVLVDDVTFLRFGPAVSVGAFHAFSAGGALAKFACRTRPYELEKGATDRQLERSLAVLVDAFERGTNREAAYRAAFEPFAAIPTGPRDRPKVAVFGDFYARDNEVFNQGLVRAIEEAGGEAVTTSYIEYLKSALDPMFRRLLKDRRYGAWARTKAAHAIVLAVERTLSLAASDWFGRSQSWSNPGYAEKLGLFGISEDHEGECFDNTLKILRLLETHPDLALFVQASPAFCCPSIITEAMSKEIERVTGVPVVTVTYDGTGSPKNDAVAPYLAFARKGSAAPR